MFEYNPEVGNKICDQMVTGRSIVEICAKIKGLKPSDVFGWIHIGERRLADEEDIYAEFVTKYRFAREVQGEQALDKIIDVEKRLGKDEITAPTANALIKSHQWRAQICRPERYTPGQKLDHGGLDNVVKPWAELMQGVTKENTDKLENAKAD